MWQGYIDPYFKSLGDVFAENVQGGDKGSSFCLHIEGRKVVDIWAAENSHESTKGYNANNFNVIFSATKAAAALCVLHLVGKNLLKLDASVATYWPEFAASGKEAITLRMVLSHQAGLPTVRGSVTRAELLENRSVVSALAAESPFWTPGLHHGYHAITFGTLIGEIVRRVTGKTLGQYFQDEIATPLGLDFYIGLPTHIRKQVGNLSITSDVQVLLTKNLTSSETESLYWRTASLNGALHGGGMQLPWWNDEAVLAAELPASNGITNARYLSRLYASTLSPQNGICLWPEALIKEAFTTQSEGIDAVIGSITRFGLGFLLSGGETNYLTPDSFGHPGFGGSIGFADPNAKMAFAYVTNTLDMSFMKMDARPQCLLNELCGL